MHVRVCVSRRVRAAEPPRVPRARAGRGQYCLMGRAILILLQIKNGMFFWVYSWVESESWNG